MFNERTHRYTLIFLVFLLSSIVSIADSDSERTRHAPKENQSESNPPTQAEEQAEHSSDQDDELASTEPELDEAEKKRLEREEQEAAAIESLQLKGERAEEFKGLIEATQTAKEELSEPPKTTSDASETGLSNEAVAKLLPLFRNITDRLDRDQLTASGANEELLTALGLDGEDNKNIRELFIQTAQKTALSLFAKEVLQEAKFAAIAIGSTQLGRNTPEGLCVGIECARDRLATANRLSPGAKSPAAAAQERDEQGSFPQYLLVDGEKVPTLSSRGVMELSRVYHIPENDRHWEEKWDYGDRAGIEKMDDIVTSLSLKDENQLRTQAAQAASFNSGYPLWVSAEFPVRDREGKPVLDENGKAKVERDGHIVTVFSLGIGDNRQLIVRDPNYPDIGTGVQVKDGVFSYSYKPPGDVPALTESWDRFIPESLYWERPARRP